MNMTVATSLPPEEIRELDRVCRDQGVSRLDAVETAVRWYIGREGDLSSIEDPTADEIEP